MRRAPAIAAFGAALAACGGAFGATSLAVPGLAMVLVGLGAPAWVLLASVGARLDRRPDASVVAEDERWGATLTIRRGRVRLPGAEVEDPLLAGPVPIEEGRRFLRVEASFPRRGRVAIAPARMAARDPLRLAGRVVATTAAHEVLVLPRIEPVLLPPEVAAAAGADEGAGGRGGREPAFELEGLGPYRPGSPMSRIHWAAVARHDELLERRFHADVDATALVILDGRGADGDRFDAAVRVAASLALHLARARGVAALLPGDHHPFEVGADLYAWPELHERLALVRPDGRAPALHPHAPARAIFWVSAGEAGAEPDALVERAGSVPCFHLSPVSRSGAPAFAVGGCRAWRVAPRERRVA